jgi:hypothetical protein
MEDGDDGLPLTSRDIKTADLEQDPARFQMHTMSDEVEAVAQQEEHELEELLALAEEKGSESKSERWGSDEEDYDDLFMEYLSSQQGSKQPRAAPAEAEDEDSMDTSIG